MVVVGAGSGGCAVAGRLSEDPALDVVLLEAGPAGPAPGTARANFLAALAEPGRLWEGPDAVATAETRPRPYLRGRGVGGSSAVNAMVGLWGTTDDSATWTAAGADGWDEAGLKPFRRLVSQKIPVSRSPIGAWSPFEQRLAEAAQSAGFPWCNDHNQAGAWGVGPAPLTIVDGRRRSAADAYLGASGNPASPLRRPNLEIRGDVMVDRVLLVGDRAWGVRSAAGDEFVADEVVLAAGAIGTPAILLRSGIVRPGVGRNLVDHPSAGFSLALAPAVRLAAEGLADHPVISSLVRYSSGLAGSRPLDMQLLPLAATGFDEAGLGTGTVQAAVMEAFSRGRLTLRSDDPAEPPRVERCLLSDRRDLVRLRDGVHRLIALLGRPEMAAVVEAVFVDDRGTRLETTAPDAVLEAWLTSHVGDYVHAAGTCRIGRPDDPLAVVDPAGRVVGRQHLWVSDASVLPTLPRANPHLTVVLIGEKVAASLLAQLHGAQ